MWAESPFDATFQVATGNPGEQPELTAGSGSPATPTTPVSTAITVATAGQTSFTLPTTPENATSLEFNWDGYHLVYGVDLTLAGVTVTLPTLNFPIPAGAVVHFQYT
jgi:hypothetical protein